MARLPTGYSQTPVYKQYGNRGRWLKGPTSAGSNMRVDGGEELKRVFQKLPDRIANKVLSSAVASGARVLRLAALSNVRGRLSGFNRFGETPAKAVVSKKDTKNSTLYNPRYIVANNSAYFYLHIMEIGGSPRKTPNGKIVPRTTWGQLTRKGTPKRYGSDAKALKIPGYGYRASADPKLQQPNPWLRPAWLENKRLVQLRIAKNMDNGLTREAKKLASTVGYTGKRRRRRR